MADTFGEQHRIVYYEGDVTGHASLTSLINMMILASEDQSAHIGVGEDVVTSYGVGWVVTQYHIDIPRMPRVGELMTIKTRGTSYNKYFALREFWLVDEAGNECAHATSIWVTMSYATRKIVPIPADILAPYHSELVRQIPRLPRPEKLTADESIEQKDYRVRYNDIDHNGHVNNAHYFDWMTDVLPAEFLKAHEPVTVNIRFENEVQYGHVITSRVGTPVNADHHLKTVHDIQLGDQTSAIADIEWRLTAN
ncbi:acyl-[acyl-carrier-protein] thioesterase [Levilactobacillus bambusae]|uniref:Acyl-ACP thioesterase n=1 Tax=Levilactobacillus bambusae TaxID=2024736 RepID=A0A2V1MWF1_9LACO|nr:acyl-ACP thioesterase domain-containing protein [Levilactobacillus bambusae]PWF99396.1 acyl-ACP thioesterase [Levilactobacillus bambusae]